MTEHFTMVAICDDEPRNMQEIATITREATDQIGIHFELTLYESGTALLRTIQSGAQYHALMMTEPDSTETVSTLYKIFLEHLKYAGI